MVEPVDLIRLQFVLHPEGPASPAVGPGECRAAWMQAPGTVLHPPHGSATHENTRSNFPVDTGTVTRCWAVSPALCRERNSGMARKQPSRSASSQASGGRITIPSSLRHTVGYASGLA